MKIFTKKFTFILIGILLFVVFFSVLLLYKDQKRDLLDGKGQKRVEIFDSYIKGYDGVKPYWEIQAKYIWLERNDYIFFARDVVGGKIFNEQIQEIVSKIKAKKIRVNSKIKILTAQGNISAELAFLNKENERIVAFVTAEKLAYYHGLKTLVLDGNVVFEFADLKIRANKIKVDTQKNLIYIKSDFEIEAKDFKIKGKNLSFEAGANKFEIKGKFRGEKEALSLDNAYAQNKIKFTANYLKYLKKKQGYRLFLKDDVRVTEAGKELRCLEVVYDTEKDTFKASGDLKIAMDQLAGLMQPEKRKNLKNKDMKRAIEQPVQIKGQELYFNGQKKELILTGGIDIAQKTSHITCDEVRYDGNLNQISFIKNVKIDSLHKNILKAQKFVVDIDKEEFWAEKGEATGSKK
jgi:lipopolysaccharide assembly outer membrane protein LptD (OstA)